MGEKYKTILVKEELHKLLKEYSIRSGIKIKVLTETAIRAYLKMIKFEEQ